METFVEDSTYIIHRYPFPYQLYFPTGWLRGSRICVHLYKCMLQHIEFRWSKNFDQPWVWQRAVHFLTRQKKIKSEKLEFPKEVFFPYECTFNTEVCFKWYVLIISASSLVFASLLFLLPRVLSTTNSHLLHDFERRSTLQQYDLGNNYIPNIPCGQVYAIFSNSRLRRKIALLVMTSSRL